MKGYLVLENGEVFEGERIGYNKDCICEVIFNTSMVGYLEVLTDPSYYGQGMCMTYPLIGNYGSIKEDFESERIWLEAIFVHELTPVDSNFRAEKSLNEFLVENKIPGLNKINTRKLTKVLRENGTMKGMLTSNVSNMEDIIDKIKKHKTTAYVERVRIEEPYTVGEGDIKIALLDFGAKKNIIKSLLKRNCKVTVFPSNSKEIQPEEFDGIVLSNGPGDPADCVEEIKVVQKLYKSNTPIFGICLGHQIMGLATGAKTAKLKYGHRGPNQPVKDIEKDKVHITSQNHGYYILEDSIDKDIAEVSHININDETVEGLRYKGKDILTVQFHPEACPGPQDSEYLFDDFIERIGKRKKRNKVNGRNKSIKKVVVIGSGPIVIGQAAEFDYAGTQACSELKKEGIEVVLINSNPATIMTDKNMADKIYIEPLTVTTVKKILLKEKPDSILPNLGGQTGLNIAMELEEEGFLKTNNIRLLGTTPEGIKKAEDRQAFKDTMAKIGEPCIASKVVNTVKDAVDFANEIGLPVVIRPAYTLGGTGGGMAYTEEELKEIAASGLSLSRVHQVLIEKCISGWKEIEFEVMRDHKGNCIAICSMENLDPVGIHTGDSIVIAPAQTLADKEYQMLRTSAIKIISELKIEGGCNVQFALHPESFEYAVIEVNPRVSRSSALASKATGYPIAKVATKIAIGYTLDEIKNSVTQKTSACFEPVIDYVVVKIPKWPFSKFLTANRELGTQMKATGEVMSIGTSIESALLKAVRSLEENIDSLILPRLAECSDMEIKEKLKNKDNERLWVVAENLRRGVSVEEISRITTIDEYFISKIDNIVKMEIKLKSIGEGSAPIRTTTSFIIKRSKTNRIYRFGYI